MLPPVEILTKKATVPDEPDEETAPDDLEDIDEESLDALEEGDDDEDLDDDELADDVLVVDDDEDLDDDELADDVLVVDVDAEGAKAGSTTAERPAEEGEEEEEEEPDDEDVEASLDVILKERLVVGDEIEDDEPTDAEDRTEASERVLPKQPDEFVCRSCFLVKHASQLADKKRGLCRDCV